MMLGAAGCFPFFRPALNRSVLPDPSIDISHVRTPVSVKNLVAFSRDLWQRTREVGWSKPKNLTQRLSSSDGTAQYFWCHRSRRCGGCHRESFCVITRSRPMRNIWRVSILLCLMGFIVSGSLLAQSDLGTISGFVKDPSGATIANAKISIRNNSGVERVATSNDSGYYTITNVPPGLYTVVAEAQGFRRYESKDNKVDPTANLVVDVALTVGSASETVQVSASAVELQTESASVQKLVTREQINSLEINGRNPIFMANLVPGTRGGTLANLSFNFSQGPSNINGARTPESLITYDGAPAVRTRSNGTSIGAADVDSTEEIQILTADYAPEYGRSSGGQIGITAPVHYNQFGYNIGGPFYIPNHFNTNKTKVFWYWGEEWVRYIFTDTN